jgi:predicted nucleotidyltransferase
MLIFDYIQMTAIDQYTNEIQRLCAVHNVRTLYVIGSVLTAKFNEQSDIDLIVDFKPQDIDHYADNYFELKFALEDVFKRKVDLLEEKTIRNPYFKQAIEKQKHLVYGA